MANRMFHMDRFALEPKVVDLYCSIDVGATGAVSASSGKGVASVVRDSAGKYTITLEDQYNALLWADVAVLDDTNSDPNTVAVAARLVSEDVNGATPTVVIQGADVATGAAADFADGAKLLVHITLKNSSLA